MKYFILFITFSFLLSCDSKRIFEQNVELENAMWNKDSVYSFQFDINDIEKDYRLLFNIRNSVDYEFYNLFLKYKLEGDMILVDDKLNEFYLFDRITGKPFGSGLGDIFDHRIPFIDSIRFNNKGPYKVSFRQFMRTDSLNGVFSVGVRLEEL